MKTRLIYLMLCMLMTSSLVRGQNANQSASQRQQTPESFFTTSREITFEDDSKTEEIIITIEKDIRSFELRINAIVGKGKVSVDVYDPENNRQGRFSVGTQLSSNKSEMASGNFSKQLRDPIAGEWRVKIAPSGASGKISIETAFIQ